MKYSARIAAALMLGAAPAFAQSGATDLQETVSAAADMEASITDDGVVRLGWQRTEVPVEISGMRLSPPAGLGSWAAFKPTEDGAIVMGDTVVFEDEITPAMDAALDHGLKVTALHNHFKFDDPPVYFMHIGGTGDPAELANGVEAMWDAIKDVRADAPQPQRRFAEEMPTGGTFDVAALESVFGTEGAENDGVVKFTFGRKGRMNGVALGASMGLSTWAAFSGGQSHATVDGDFIMTGDEVQTVIRNLRAYGIHIVALHNHMIGESPTFYFLHYWGTGPAKDLAQGVRAALDAQTGQSSE